MFEKMVNKSCSDLVELDDSLFEEIDGGGDCSKTCGSTCSVTCKKTKEEQDRLL